MFHMVILQMDRNLYAVMLVNTEMQRSHKDDEATVYDSFDNRSGDNYLAYCFTLMLCYHFIVSIF
jgi:hypothetical protein